MVLVFVVACSAKRAPESQQRETVGGAPPPEATPVAPPPPQGGSAAAPTGSATGNRQQAAQEGVLGSTTTSNAEAFEPIGKGGKPVVEPTLKLDAPVVKGPLDKAIVRRYLARNAAKIRECYKDAPAGKLTATFTISAEGVVTKATAKGMSETVTSCVAGVIKAIEFPKPTKPGDVVVESAMTFAPAPQK